MTAQAAPWPADAGETSRLGMWIFLASEVLFFGGLLLAYAYARSHWPAGFALAGRHTHVLLGTVNTALLLTSSGAIALAVACAGEQGPRRWSARLLWLTLLLGAAFLAVKGFEYRQEWNEGLFPGPAFALKEQGAELFFWLYFVLTGLHALHMLAGLAVVGALAWGAQRARPWAGAEAIELGALYWHFVDVVWIVLYPLLYLVGRNA